MTLYSGIDLHSNNLTLAIMDETGKRILKKKLINDSGVVLATFEPYRNELVGIVVESTYNWYWLVDELMEHGYQVHLSHPSGNKQYSGLKHRDDEHDAFWLCDLLRLKTLKEGYIYPREQRPVRDLARKRLHLNRLKTSLTLSLKAILARNFRISIKAEKLRDQSVQWLIGQIPPEQNIVLAVQASKACIDFLNTQVHEIETSLLQQLKGKTLFVKLLTLPGVGKILGWTIQLETGPISRFAEVGHYASYCRKVQSRWSSNDRYKGHGNEKNGNPYLAWAYSEAAEEARRFYPACRTFYNRKLNQTNAAVAHNALAHKLARAAYYIMRDNVPYDEKKMFG
jgi:transposase